MALTPFEVYGFMEPTIPSGYVVDEFRPPKKGEFFLPTYEVYRRRPDAVRSAIDFEDPRLILRKFDSSTTTTRGAGYVVKPSLEAVYGTNDPKIPEGYIAVDFRLPNLGENYLYLGGNVNKAFCNHTSHNPPYLILVKKSVGTVAVYPNGYKVPKEYLYAGFRTIQKGEQYLGLDNQVYTCSDVFSPAKSIGEGLRIVVTKREIEISDVHPNYKLPEGYEFLGFRKPYPGEHYLGTKTNKVYQDSHGGYYVDTAIAKGKRVIVRPIPAPPKQFRLVRVLEYIGTKEFIDSISESSFVTADGPRVREPYTKVWKPLALAGRNIRELSTFKEEVK